MKRDVWGEPIKTASTTPFATSEQVTSPLEKELQELQLYPALPGPTAQYWKMNKDVYEKFVEISGKLKKATLDQSILSPEYKAASPDEKVDFIEKALDKVNSEVRGQMIGKIIAKQLGIKDVSPEIIGYLYAELRKSLPKIDTVSQRKREEAMRKVIENNKSRFSTNAGI